MAVVTEEGLVGKTTTVATAFRLSCWSRMKTAAWPRAWKGRASRGLSPANASPARLTPLLDLNFLSKQANLSAGPESLHLGVGGVFPSGLLIGTVKDFKMRELDGQAHLIPAVDLSKLEDVFVVTGTANDLLRHPRCPGFPRADHRALHSAARVDVQRAHLHCADHCFLRRDGAAVSRSCSRWRFSRDFCWMS